MTTKTLSEMTVDTPQADLRPVLVERLRTIRAPEGTRGRHSHGGSLFSHCALDRERLASIRLEAPLIGILLRGRKEVWIGDRMSLFLPGTVFVLPAGVEMDVVNIPAENAAYESLILEVARLPDGIAPLIPFDQKPVAQVAQDPFIIPLTPDLVDTLAHAARAIASAAIEETVARVRLIEVLTVLRSVPAAAPLFSMSLADQVAWLIRSAPDEDWSVERLARKLGIGASTLRRRLSGAGRPFRSILRTERLTAAAQALSAGASSIAAAEAAGYASRSHFARHFREDYGVSPKALRTVR
ncbi:helix-turn-helix domain-containing protein [Rhizobium sp. YIM 134829]|uniref:helix-turn-helix domain-containing protein n=1 Tax=Rhizobium sp. YIM 134829 TaxID=3390453 RepID=UPI00397B7D12